MKSSDFNRWMKHYAHPPEDEDDDPLPEPPEIELPYSLKRSFSLWVAWKDQGVMPHVGGYLDQPRAWERMIDYFNERYHFHYRNKDSNFLDESTLPSDMPNVTFESLMRG